MPLVAPRQHRATSFQLSRPHFSAAQCYPYQQLQGPPMICRRPEVAQPNKQYVALRV